MLAAIAILVLQANVHGFEQGGSAWVSAANELRGIEKTYEKWGITVSVGHEHSFDTDDETLPRAFNIAGSFETPDTLSIEMNAEIGDKGSTSLEMGGSYKIGVDGTAKEGSMSAFVDGTGYEGSFAGSAAEGFIAEGTLEQALYKFGVQIGKTDEGPCSFGIKLGPVEIDVDPTKYAQRLRKVGPKLLEAAKRKIGGVSLSVDVRAMAYALANAPQPPPDFLLHTYALSLRQLLADRRATLDPVDDIQGVLVSEQTHDIWIVGVHKPGAPPIPTERLATLVQAIYERGLHPFVSIEPQGNIHKPHLARVGGIPSDLASSSLIETMLTADYAMKQIVQGARKIPGIPATIDLVEKANWPIVATRFWINPAPILPGALRIAVGNGQRLYEMRSSPVVSDRQLSDDYAPGSPSLTLAGRMRQRSRRVTDAEARYLTYGYDEIKKAWPMSDLAEAAQDIQLSNILTLMREREQEPWEIKLMRGFQAVQIPKAAVPTSFPALDSPVVSVAGFQFQLTGGMTTAIDLPRPEPVESPITESAVSPASPYADLGANGEIDESGQPPQTLGPTSIGDRLLRMARQALVSNHLKQAFDFAGQAASLEPTNELARLVALDAMSRYYGVSSRLGPDPVVEAAFDSAEKSFPSSPAVLELRAQYDYDAGCQESAIADRNADWSDAESVLKQEIALAPQSTFPLDFEAKIERRLGDVPTAEQTWVDALRINPLDAGAIFGISGVFAMQGKLGPSISGMTSLCKVDPTARNFLMLALVDVQAARQSADQTTAGAFWAGAARSVRRSLTYDSYDWTAYDTLGQIQFLRHHYRDAAAELSNAQFLATSGWVVGRGPSLVPSRYRIEIPWEDFTLRCGERPAVASTPDAQRDAPPYDPLILYTRGECFMKLGKWKQALSDLKACFFLPDFIPLRARLAQKISQCLSHLKRPNPVRFVVAGAGLDPSHEARLAG